MDRAYEDAATRREAVRDGRIPEVPPKSNRRKPWQLDANKYEKRNEIERMKEIGTSPPATTSWIGPTLLLSSWRSSLRPFVG